MMQYKFSTPMRSYAAWLMCVIVIFLCLTAPVSASQLNDSKAEAAPLPGATADWTAVLEPLKLEAAQGSIRAMAYLGWMYEEGHGVARDMAMSAEWYERAALAGAPRYAVKLGWLHLQGQLGKADRERAEYWFAEAIDAGHAPAKIALASVLMANAMGGRDVDRIDEARVLLEQAHAQDEPLAAYFLARLYLEGVGGHETDIARGAEYTRVGAENGNAQMQAWLAMMYADGAGVKRDEMETAFWAALSAAGGDPLGLRLHAQMREQLSDEQRRSIMQRTVSWLDGR